MVNLAILSPNQDAYSETFIKAHRYLPFNVFYYYGDYVPTYLEGEGRLMSSFAQIKSKVLGKLNVGPGKLSVYQAALKKSFQKNNIQVVLAEYGQTGADSLPVLQELGIPLIVHFHGYDASMTSVLEAYKVRYQKMFSYAKAVVVVSHKMRSALEAAGCPPDKMHHIVYGFNNRFLNAQPTYHKNQFVALGRFVDKKAPYLTIAAFKKVVASYPDAQLVLGGNGPLYNACINLVQAWHLQNNIDFRNVMTPDDVIACFNESLAFVQHSVTALSGDSEGTPVAVIEAMAAALPVVATRHAGIPDVVKHNETGLLVEETDIETMAAYMIKLIEDHDLAKQMGQDARKYAINNLTMDSYLNKIASLITA